MDRLNLKKLIAESREIAEALDEFADKLEKIEKAKELDGHNNKCADKLEDPDKYLYSNDGFPYFMEELTEDDLDERQKIIWANPRMENY